jgi:hypothetical protein
MEAPPGLGCGLTRTFRGSALSFIRGSVRFERRCHDIVSGRATDESCVSLTMVSHKPGTWSSGTLHVYVRQHGRGLLVDNVEYGDGDSCFTPEFPCTTDRELWAQRVDN